MNTYNLCQLDICPSVQVEVDSNSDKLFRTIFGFALIVTVAISVIYLLSNK